MMKTCILLPRPGGELGNRDLSISVCLFSNSLTDLIKYWPNSDIDR